MMTYQTQFFGHSGNLRALDLEGAILDVHVASGECTSCNLAGKLIMLLFIRLRLQKRNPRGLRALCIGFYFTRRRVLPEVRHPHAHIQEKQLHGQLKFMHTFIEQLYKILLIVESACLICQQFWS